MHFMFGLLLFFISQALIAQDFLWVSSKTVKLKAERSTSSQTLTVLNAGDKLEHLAYQKRWYQVKTADNTIGWIYRGKVTKTKPVTLDESLFMPMDNFPLQMAAVDTSRSIRSKQRAKSDEADSDVLSKQSLQKALDRILAIRISQKKLAHFLKKGKLAEYAE